jgi:anti-sigma B factor antagonist
MAAYHLDYEQIQSGVQLLRISGEITSQSAPALRAEVSNLIDSGCKTFVFDFSAVDDIDSVGISALLVISKMAAKTAIFGANTHIQKTLELAQVTRYIKVTRTQEEALSGQATMPSRN